MLYFDWFLENLTLYYQPLVDFLICGQTNSLTLIVLISCSIGFWQRKYRTLNSPLRVLPENPEQSRVRGCTLTRVGNEHLTHPLRCEVSGLVLRGHLILVTVMPSALQYIPHWFSRLHFLEPWGKTPEICLKFLDISYQKGDRFEDKEEVSRNKKMERPPWNWSRREALPGCSLVFEAEIPFKASIQGVKKVLCFSFPTGYGWNPNRKTLSNEAVAKISENLLISTQVKELRGEGNGNPFQSSRRGNPVDRGAWQSMGSQRVRQECTEHPKSHTYKYEHTDPWVRLSTQKGWEGHTHTHTHTICLRTQLRPATAIM